MEHNQCDSTPRSEPSDQPEIESKLPLGDRRFSLAQIVQRAVIGSLLLAVRSAMQLVKLYIALKQSQINPVMRLKALFQAGLSSQNIKQSLQAIAVIAHEVAEANSQLGSPDQKKE